MPSKPIYQQKMGSSVRPLVSVFVPAYNQEKYISLCLDKILIQSTNFPVEIIVSDDASTDGTAKEIRKYQEKFPDIVKPIYYSTNQLRQGKKIRRKFHEMAMGEFLASCDGDDFWSDPHKLAKQVDFLMKNDSYVLSFHDSVNFNEATKKQWMDFPEKARRDFSQEELKNMTWCAYILLGTVLYRNVIDALPTEFDLVPNGDNFLPRLLGKFGAAKFQSDIAPLARRIHETSLFYSKNKTDKNRMHLQSYLQMSSYFLRIGDYDTAEKLLTGGLPGRVKEYLGLASASREVDRKL